ncbi:hypothetical protein ACFY2T_20280 [Streptomyces sp. NPDC001260]|uniref:hypothetical protein n=1 Tax=Streptomyces sp. NPDC001260 TaxID=3364551 RepID=UPI0036B23685
MDAGLAAVLGALAGAVATTGAALATGWSAREQAKIAARAEHRRQRRDARQVVYEEFISAALAHENHAGRIFVAPVPEDAAGLDLVVRGCGYSNWDAISTESHGHHINLLKFSTRVQLAGPKEITRAAMQVNEHSGRVMSSFLEIPAGLLGAEPLPDRFRKGLSRWLELEDAISNFTEVARLALDDDGTSR